MADKQIKIRASLDTSGIDQQVKQMQDRLSQIVKQSNTMRTTQSEYGKGSGMSRLAQGFFGDSNRGNVNELREQFNLNVRKAQSDLRQLKEKEREMGKLQKLQEAMTSDQKERVKLLNEEIKALKEKGRVLLEENNKIAGVARGLGVDDLAGAGFKGTGTAPAMGQPQGFFGRMRAGAANILSQMGGGSVMAGVGTLARGAGFAGLAGVQMAGDYVDYQRTRDRQLARDIGSAVQGRNIEMDTIMQGRGFMNRFEDPERQTAMQMAMSEREKRIAMDPLKAAGSVGTSILGYGAAGAIGGSLFGGIGAVPGAIAGGIYGAGKSILGDKGVFRQMFDREAYTAAINAETMQNFRANLTAQRMQDPLKFAGANLFSQRAGSMQQLQRQLGMGDRDIMGDALVDEQPDYAGLMNRPYGARDFSEVAEEQAESARRQNEGRRRGFLERSMRDRSGAFSFSEERIRQNIGGILQSGGTTDFVTQQMGATMAAEYQRGGMANAARQMGAISGLGNVEGQKTEEQYKKFIADAMRTGLDESDFAKETVVANEEVRRTMQAITDVYTQSGGAEGAVDVFQAGLMGGAGTQVRAAQSVFQRRNQELGQGTGYRGALKYAFMNSEQGQEMFGGLPNYLKNAFTSYNLQNLDVDDPLIQQAADELGISAEEMVDRVGQLQRSGENYSAVADQARQNLQGGYEKYLTENNLQDTAANRRAFQETEQGRKLVAESVGMAGQERGDDFLQMSAQEKSAYAFSQMQLPENLRGEAPGLDTRARGAFDAEEGSRAADRATQLEVLNQQLPKLVEAAQQSAEESAQTRINTFESAQRLQELVDYAEKGGDDVGGALMNTFFGNQPSMGNQTDD